jgi:hypothetical protein
MCVCIHVSKYVHGVAHAQIQEHVRMCVPRVYVYTCVVSMFVVLPVKSELVPGARPSMHKCKAMYACVYHVCMCIHVSEYVHDVAHVQLQKLCTHVCAMRAYTCKRVCVD